MLEANLTTAIFCLCSAGGLGESAEGGEASHAARTLQSQQMDYRWWECSIEAQRIDLRGIASKRVAKGSGDIRTHEALE